jgi:hypothetical protein
MASLRLDTAADANFRTHIVQMLTALHQDPNRVALVMRWNLDDNLVWIFNSLPNGQTVVQGGGAGHAEEVMIARWGQCRAQNGNNPPNSVEILLTKSPCLDRSPKPPVGCAQKLGTLIRTAGTESWTICYFNAYQEDTHIPAQSGGATALLGTITGVDIYRFKDRHPSLPV